MLKPASCGLGGAGQKDRAPDQTGQVKPTPSPCKQLIHIKVAAAHFEIRIVLRNASVDVAPDHFNAIRVLFQRLAEIDSRHGASQKE
jgi:hypothetical protein